MTGDGSNHIFNDMPIYIPIYRYTHIIPIYYTFNDISMNIPIYMYLYIPIYIQKYIPIYRYIGMIYHVNKHSLINLKLFRILRAKYIYLFIMG